MSGGGRLAPVLALAALLPARAAAEPARDVEGEVRLSYVRFTEAFGAGGGRRSLDDLFSDASAQASRVAIDAAVFEFAGRRAVGPVTVAVRVPLVRLSRSGRSTTDDGATASLFAEGFSAGDVTAEVRFERPIAGIADRLGGAVLAVVPTGTWRELEAGELPTGSGEVGFGGEIGYRSGPATVGPGGLEAGGAVGMTVSTSGPVAGGGIDRGDARWARGDLRFASPRRAVEGGIAWLVLARDADRVDGRPVAALDRGGEPGRSRPAARLTTVGPFVEARAGGRRRETRLRVALESPAAVWLYAPVGTGVAVDGRNLLVPGPQLTVSVRGAL